MFSDETQSKLMVKLSEERNRQVLTFAGKISVVTNEMLLQDTKFHCFKIHFHFLHNALF